VAPSTPVDGNAAANTVSEAAANGDLVGITATASDIHGGTVTFALSDDAGGRFAIDAATGVVTVADAALLDFETATSHAITVTASDGTLTSSQSFTIAVTDVAPSTPVDGNAAANTVSEAAANGDLVGITASATDVHGGTVTFALSDDAGGRFAIDAATGVVSVANAALLDFETATSHDITVTASDGTLTSSQSFSIAVTDVAPSTPVDGNAAANTVSEAAANGDLVGITASASDIHGGTVTFALSDDAGGRFAIDAATGVVTVANAALLDFETATSHNITVTAADPSGAFTSQSFSIAVTDVAPTQPVDGNAAANTVSEGAANGDLVGITATASDVHGGTVTFALSDDAGGRFAIDAATGVVTVADSSKLDFETATSHDITVTASDGTLTSSQSFSIAVTDVAPSQPVDGNAAANTVSEAAANGDLVGITASASDIHGGTVTFALSDDAGGRFAIDAATGVVTVANAALLDFETATSHDITVTASDGTLVSSQSFTIAVTDVAPSQPVDGNAATNTVSEAAANGDLVGITASASDVHGGTVTFALSDDAGGRFAIDAATGVVTVADSSLLDFETATSHDITVTASDGTLTSSQSFSIAVTDVAPSTPIDGNAAANTVSEAAANGTTVGITASASDIHGGTVTFALSDDAGGRFAIDAATGVVTVADAALLDFETSSSHDITVTASDGTLTSSQSFTIAVTDVAPSQPVDSNAAANTVSEGAANGDLVGITASATDVHGGTVTFALSDDAGGRFAIDAATGVVTVADASLLDFETATSHSITVTASDGTLVSSQSFSIAVTDVAPSTPVDGNAAANTVAEGAANGSTVGVTASASDVNGPAVTYSLTGDSSGGGFTINAATGVVTIADSTKIDYESAPGHAYTVTAQASDGTLVSSQSFSIAVTDVAPSTPVDSNAATNTVAEGAANGTAVGVTASATDVNGPAVTYSLTGDSSGGGFTINAATGVVTIADSTKIDYESAPGHAYTVTAQASDGTLASSQSFSIAVTDVAPSTPVDSNAGTNTVAEGAANGTAVGVTASASDVNGPAVTYSLTGDSSGGGFTINAATGVVTVADSTKIDYESAPGHAYTVTAQASDGTLVSSQSFSIAVTDVAPSTPVDSNAATNTVAEGAANGTAVGVTASATDVNGPAVTYSLTGDSSGGGFTINAATGVVTVADSSKIDYESSPGHAYTVTAQASDGTLVSSQSFSIAVTDVAPSTPVDSNAAANTIAEGAANGTAVGVTATSSDVNGPAVTYSLTGDSSGGGFTINAATGVVTVADSTKIDYESSPGHAYTVTAQASDGTLASSQTFTIAVSDVAPSTPVDSNGATNTVAEGAANGSTVGVTASASDVNGPAVTYSLTGDTSGGGFTINAATGVVTVADASKIDYESSPGHAYTVTAQASDGTLVSSQSFSIAVTDVAPSTPVDSNAAANTIAEGAANGTAVGVTATSSDVNGPAVTYSLTGDSSGGGFTINAATGVVTIADSTKIDYESAPGHAYTVTAQASDGTLASSQSFTIAVSDVNEAPVANADTGAVNEDATLTVTAANGVIQGTTGGSVADTDVDNATNTLLVSGVVAGTGAVTQGVGVGSSLVGTYGHLTLNANGSYSYVADTANSLAAGIQAVDTFTYTDKDPGGLVSNTTTLKITVTGINDAPVVTTQSPANLNVASGVLVSSFRSSTDVDAGALHGIAITALSSNGGGAWQYSTNGGSSWTNIGTVSATSALLLDDSNLVRIIGSGNSGTLTYKAWDETTGTVGTKVNPGAGGGTTAFSTATNTLSATHPAGIAGEQINLGLTDPSADHLGAVTLTIAGISAGWALSEGTDNGDGTWTVVTSDVASLFVTSPSTYTGALVLNVAETWTNADGSTGHAMVADNLEAYVPGNPVFALSGDDYLTGSSGHDQFVFSQPIGHDVIYNFDATSDQIDLIGYAGFTGFGDILAHMADDAAGNAVIALGDGQSITLHGVDANSLTANDFVFEQTPVTENAGNMVISDGATMPLSGVLHNTGSIALNSTGDETDLHLIEHGITLEGGGHVDLSDSGQNVITGTASDVTLTNVDNTISGAGQLGAGLLTVVNQGTIDATGTNSLVIDTGTNAVINSGTLEATGTGGLEVHSDVINTGVLWANGGNITIDGNVSGNGTAQISGSATLEFGAASSANVAVDAQATGTIVLHDSFDFSGAVSGFNGDDHLDLLDVAFGTGATASYVANQDGAGGTLSVTDGIHTANIILLGQYDPAGFQTEADKNTGTLISYHDHLA
ncbi:cadherin domain-containing protein, partial [Bradyrhizobium betae]|uniref:cadherin domain-containing protein n=1 Tax=Bradyrhizobium betae TaxID=244734 RepID=UPI0019D6CD35